MGHGARRGLSSAPLIAAVIASMLIPASADAEVLAIPAEACSETSDSAPAIQAFVATVPNGASADAPTVVTFPEGATCQVDVTLDLGVHTPDVAARANTVFDLSGATLLRPVEPPFDQSRPLVRLMGVTGVTVSNGTIRGALVRGSRPAYDGTRAKYHGVRVVSGHDVILTGLSFVDLHGDCVDVDGTNMTGPSVGVTIANSWCQGAGRQGISASSVDSLLIDGVTFDFIARSAVDLEPAGSKVLRNVTVQNSTFKWIGNFALAGVGSSPVWENVVFQNNSQPGCDAQVNANDCFSPFAYVGNGYDRGPLFIRDNQLTGKVTLKRTSGSATGNAVTANPSAAPCFVTTVESLTSGEFAVSGNVLPAGMSESCEFLSAPVVSPSPTSLAFGERAVGTGVSGDVTVANTGTGGLHVSEVRLIGAEAGPLSILAQDCTGVTVPAGGSCRVSVRFAPTAAGTFVATLELVDDAADSPQQVPVTGTAYVDDVPPVVACGSPDGVWHGTDVAIACTASDAGVGLTDPADASFSLSTSVSPGTESADALTESRPVCDLVANCATAGPVGGNLVDRRGPSVAASVSPDPDATGWSSSPVTVTFACTDGGSGVASCPAGVTVPADGAAQAVTGTATDAVGNVGSATVVVSIDTTPPSVTCDTADGVWHGTDVAVECSAGDAGSGLADPADASFSLMTAVPDGTWATNAPTGTRSVCDAAGNCTTAGPVAGNMVDREPPSVTAALSPAPNSAGWNSTAVTVSFGCTDAGSGVAASCPGDVVVAADGAAQPVTGTATDLVGNAGAATASVNVDTVPPAVVLTGVSNGATYAMGAVPAPACGTADVLSGVATPSTVAVAGGNPDGTGTFTATCSGGTDRAGNLAPPVSVSYTVTGPAARVSVSETGFSPKSLSVQQGSVVLWTFDGTGQQSLVDSTSTGLFGTDAQAPGSAYSFTFFAAGTYPYRDGLHSTLGGTVSVPLTVSPAAGATGTSFTVTWSCQTAPAGYVFDVQIRRPNSRSFVNWRTGVTVGQDTFVPDAGAGTYWFRAQIRNTANGKASKYSPLGTITVS